jgi:DNA-binding NtrC family response regulator
MVRCWSADTQAALLQVPQEREFEGVRGRDRIRADARLTASTHGDLSATVAAGSFR